MEIRALSGALHCSTQFTGLVTPNTGRLGRIRASPSRGTNQPNGGLFHATAATNPICAGAGSGKRRDETKKRTFNTPAPTQHHRYRRAKRITTSNGTRRRRFCPAAGRSARFVPRSKHAQVHARECRSAAAGRTHCRLVVGRSVSDAYATAAVSSHVPLRRY